MSDQVDHLRDIEHSADYRAGMEAATDLAQPIIEARERDMYEAMRERDEARQQLRGAVAARDALAKLVREIRVSLFDGDGNKLPGSAAAFAKIDATLGGGS